MDYKERQKTLVEEYNKNLQLMAQINNRNQQIIGQLQMVEEMGKEVEPIEEAKTEEVKKEGE